MLGLAVRIYRANPVRPHCGYGYHTLLCRLIVPWLPAVTCGEQPSNNPIPRRWW